MTELKALDLYCGAGGASDGLVEAGFIVIGVDIAPQPEYPYTFVQADASTLPMEFLQKFDFIWASPPCQLFTRAKHLRKAQGKETKSLNLIPPTRELLKSAGIPYVIENVVGSPLRQDLVLCGSSFGLKVRRHRIFECSFTVFQPECRHKEQGRPIGVYYVMGDEIPGGGRTAKTIEEARLAMGTNRMSWKYLKESIPPVYSKYIATCFLLDKESEKWTKK